VAGSSDAAPIEAPTEARKGCLNEIQLVEDARHVLDSEAPDLG